MGEPYLKQKDHFRSDLVKVVTKDEPYLYQTGHIRSDLIKTVTMDKLCRCRIG